MHNRKAEEFNGKEGKGHEEIPNRRHHYGRTILIPQFTGKKARELAQQYADQYLAGFMMERVLPFTGMQYIMYSVGLRNSQRELRSLHINSFANGMPCRGCGF